MRFVFIVSCVLFMISVICAISPLAYRLSPMYATNQFERAIESGDINKVKSMLSDGTRVSTQCRDGSSRDLNWCLPIHIAARNGNVELLELLLEHGANPDSRDSNGETPLMDIVNYSARPGHRKCISRLLMSGATIDALRPGDCSTALHIASHHENTSMVDFLIESGANPNLINAAGTRAAITLPSATEEKEL